MPRAAFPQAISAAERAVLLTDADRENGGIQNENGAASFHYLSEGDDAMRISFTRSKID
jgi:hypothetical protein